jgi:hypothetical protein
VGRAMLDVVRHTTRKIYTVTRRRGDLRSGRTPRCTLDTTHPRGGDKPEGDVHLVGGAGEDVGLGGEPARGAELGEGDVRGGRPGDEGRPREVVQRPVLALRVGVDLEDADLVPHLVGEGELLGRVEGKAYIDLRE